MIHKFLIIFYIYEWIRKSKSTLLFRSNITENRKDCFRLVYTIYQHLFYSHRIIPMFENRKQANKCVIQRINFENRDYDEENRKIRKSLEICLRCLMTYFWIHLIGFDHNFNRNKKCKISYIISMLMIVIVETNAFYRIIRHIVYTYGL